eukprot:10664277-Alexandrium_andersonii.AAC.1
MHPRCRALVMYALIACSGSTGSEARRSGVVADAPFASSGSARRGRQGAGIDGVSFPYGMRRRRIVLQVGDLPQGMRGRRAK